MLSASETERERIVIVSFGGGVDSTVIIAAYLNPSLFMETIRKMGKEITLEEFQIVFPPLTSVMFSDPGSEYAHTYRNVRYAESLCKTAGIEFMTVRLMKDGKPYKIFDWLTDKNRGRGLLPLIPGSGQHTCSNKFKGAVMQAKGDELYGKDTPKTWLIGIEANEKKRTDRFTMNKDQKKTSNEFRYPLMELGLTREDCQEVLRRMGWILPAEGNQPEIEVGKSSCAWCPFIKEWEIHQLFELATKENADSHDVRLLQEAFEIEDYFTNSTKDGLNLHDAWHNDGEPLRGGKNRENRELSISIKDYKSLSREEKKEWTRPQAAWGYHSQPFQSGECGEPSCLHFGPHPEGAATLVALKKDGSRKTFKEWFEEWKEQF